MPFRMHQSPLGIPLEVDALKRPRAPHLGETQALWLGSHAASPSAWHEANVRSFQIRGPITQSVKRGVAASPTCRLFYI